ncbi:MAG TPA: pyridoxamine 5'-phosphate oxidase family protein [Tepidiformaceae bacterium]|nr:pyridoxamine 5'-phosphate oxidase family protein [Tepidiformaceae bacterium]
MPIDLTDDMRRELDEALANRNVVLVASASGAGVPDIAYKGSVMVWDAEHLAYWERSRGQTMRNLTENPNICLMFRNPETRISWKFFGEAQVLDSGELREQIMARANPLELKQDPERKGAGVLIKINRVLERGQPLMERDG